MAWLKNNVGFWGWRYDQVKGFPGWAIEMYNNHTVPGFSVGECMDGNVNTVIAWINSTHPTAAKRATAFDFPLRYTLYDVVVHGKYQNLKYADKLAGLIGMWADKAVTFVENHDTEEARNGAYTSAIPNDSRMLQAYAFILTHPGTPCVYWPDIYKMGSSVESALRQMIWARKHYGIHSESPVYIAKAAQGDCYAAYITGDNGQLAIKIGPGAWSPSGTKWHAVNDRITWGTDYCIWGEHGKWWTLW
jgi:alpha-amylase